MKWWNWSLPNFLFWMKMWIMSIFKKKLTIWIKSIWTKLRGNLLLKLWKITQKRRKEINWKELSILETGLLNQQLESSKITKSMINCLIWSRTRIKLNGKHLCTELLSKTSNEELLMILKKTLLRNFSKNLKGGESQSLQKDLKLTKMKMIMLEKDKWWIAFQTKSSGIMNLII